LEKTGRDLGDRCACALTIIAVLAGLVFLIRLFARVPWPP
jgi:hypothetical protein